MVTIPQKKFLQGFIVRKKFLQTMWVEKKIPSRAVCESEKKNVSEKKSCKA